MKKKKKRTATAPPPRKLLQQQNPTTVTEHVLHSPHYDNAYTQRARRHYQCQWQFTQTKLFHMKQYNFTEWAKMQNRVFHVCVKGRFSCKIAIGQNSLVNCRAEVPSSTLITLWLEPWGLGVGVAEYGGTWALGRVVLPVEGVPKELSVLSGVLVMVGAASFCNWSGPGGGGNSDSGICKQYLDELTEWYMHCADTHTSFFTSHKNIQLTWSS